MSCIREGRGLVAYEAATHGLVTDVNIMLSVGGDRATDRMCLAWQLGWSLATALHHLPCALHCTLSALSMRF